MNAAWLRPRWLFSRRAAKALLLAVVIIAAAVGANLVGIYLVGSVAGWERWLAASAGYFLVWGGCACTARRSMAGSGCAAGCWPARKTRKRGDAWCAARSPASSPSWRWKPAC